MYVAFDDTDSTEGMCTTFLATEMIEELRDLDLIGLPRLVRLNPAVPWKTRGNGAICLRFGRGLGARKLVGRMASGPLYLFKRGEGAGDPGEAAARCAEVLARWSRVGEGASPGLIVAPRKPRESFYWSAVRGIVERSDVGAELRRIGASKAELAGGRGVIGATAAAAWRPKDRTYEVITYRSEGRWGTGRDVDEEAVKALDRRFPSTFNNYDRLGRRMAVAPSSPCPVLFGIRGDELEELVPAMSSVPSESIDRWLLYLTNQATDDHIIADWRELVPNRSYAIRGTVAGVPRTIKGGHVVFVLELHSERGRIDCTAYEPSKGFRDVVRALRPGDSVKVLGELRATPLTLNIEKLQVIRLAEVVRKIRNPTCPSCGKGMKSIGLGAGYRCRICGTRAGASEASKEHVARDISEGWYEPPVCSRRHLSKPLKRMGVEDRESPRPGNIKIETKH